MNQSFTRKIIYIVIIGLLLIPISMIAQPSSIGGAAVGTNDSASPNRSQSVGSAGGELAKLRRDFMLSQDQVSQIDPTSEVMKLVSLGLRGVAVNLLWGQANEHKKNENWEGLEATLNMLVKVQPNFVKVWDFQAHNLSYNISMEFDDYEYRYHWVKKGIRFLSEGIGYNYRDHRITDSLGFFTGMKIGYSDEKVQFRRMFRKDTDFHNEMAKYIEPDSYYLREFEYDNWKMAYMWYQKSRNLVENEKNRQYKSDLIFYMMVPAQLRNVALSLQKEFRTNEAIQAYWAQANKEWVEYGNRAVRDMSKGTTTTLEGIAELDIRLNRLRDQLDEMAPGIRESLLASLREQIGVTDEIQAILDTPIDQRTDEERFKIRSYERQLAGGQLGIDQQVLSTIPEELATKGIQIFEQMQQISQDMSLLESNQSISNYRYWKTLSQVESERTAVTAHQQLYDATELERKSIFDDEYDIDLETGDKVITKVGAISVYEKSFDLWEGILTENPILVLGKLGDDIVDELMMYKRMLKVTGQKWPRKHPLQFFIDRRAMAQEGDKLPTSIDIAELYEGVDDEEENGPANMEDADSPTDANGVDSNSKETDSSGAETSDSDVNTDEVDGSEDVDGNGGSR
ncbi:MAG: hypothetical protein R3C03_12780 [Pirellulaceae bacterium]